MHSGDELTQFLDSSRSRVEAIQRELYRCAYCRESRMYDEGIVLIGLVPRGRYICSNCVLDAQETLKNPQAEQNTQRGKPCTVCIVDDHDKLLYGQLAHAICEDCVKLASTVVEDSRSSSELESDRDLLTAIVYLEEEFASRLSQSENGLFIERLSKRQFVQYRSKRKFDKTWSKYLSVDEVENRLDELQALQFLY